MTKREKVAFVRRVWKYLQDNLYEAFMNSNEVDFDWYSEGNEAFWCLLQDRPIKITPRVKSLAQITNRAQTSRD